MTRYQYYAATSTGVAGEAYTTKEEALAWARCQLEQGARLVNVFLRVGDTNYLVETLRQATAALDTYRAVVVEGNAASFVGATRAEATQWGLDRRVLDGANVVDIYLEVAGQSYLIDRLMDPRVWQYQAIDDIGEPPTIKASPRYLTPEEAIAWGEARIAGGVKRVCVYLLKEKTTVEHTILLPE
jgi:hypothetical protein